MRPANPQPAESATLHYARPGTVRRKRNWRPWTAVALWVSVFVIPPVLLLNLDWLERLGPSMQIVIVAAALAIVFCPAALIVGYFLYPRLWRDSAVAILIMVVSVLIPILMWMRG